MLKDGREVEMRVGSSSWNKIRMLINSKLPIYHNVGGWSKQHL